MPTWDSTNPRLPDQRPVRPIRGKERRSRAGLARGSTRGQSLVEFSFVLPLLMLLIFGIIDFGMGFHSWINVTNAAREGARLAAVHAASSGSVDCNPLPSAGTIERKICDNASNLNPDKMTITVTNADPDGTNSGQPVTVQVNYTYDLITPFAHLINLSNLTLSSKVEMRLE